MVPEHPLQMLFPIFQCVRVRPVGCRNGCDIDGEELGLPQPLGKLSKEGWEHTEYCFGGTWPGRASSLVLTPPFCPQDPSKYQCGKSKVFFRAGQVAYLEELRYRRLRAACTLLQRHLRGWLARRRFGRVRAAVLCLQRHARGLLARR